MIKYVAFASDRFVFQIWLLYALALRPSWLSVEVCTGFPGPRISRDNPGIKKSRDQKSRDFNF